MTPGLPKLDRLQPAREADQQRPRQRVLDLAAPVLRVLDDLADLVPLLGRELPRALGGAQLGEELVLFLLLGIDRRRLRGRGGGAGLGCLVLLGARRTLTVAR